MVVHRRRGACFEQLDGDRRAARLRRAGGDGANAALDFQRARIVDGARLDAQRDGPRHDIGLIGADREVADRRDGLADVTRGGFDRQHDLGGRAQRI